MPQTGVGRYTRELVRGLLSAQQFETTLLYPERVGTTRAMAAEWGELGARLRGYVLPARVLYALWNRTSGPPIEWLAGPCDVYHATQFIAPPARRARVVTTVHDLTALRFPQWHTATQREIGRHIASSIRRSDLVIAISQATANDLFELLSVPPERVRVIPLAAAAQFFAPVLHGERAAVRARLGLSSGYFLYVGTLEPRKNLEQLLLAHRCLPVPLQRAFPLFLAGGRGWEDQGIMAALAATPHARWLGRVEEHELPALLAEATAFVYPSLYEGFGLPVLEAMAVGTPVITSNTSSLPEVVGEAAIMLAPDDTEGLAGAMARLAEDAALRQSLQVLGRAQAATFSWPRTVALTVGAYHASLA